MASLQKFGKRVPNFFGQSWAEAKLGQSGQDLNGREGVFSGTIFDSFLDSTQSRQSRQTSFRAKNLCLAYLGCEIPSLNILFRFQRKFTGPDITIHIPLLIDMTQCLTVTETTLCIVVHFSFCLEKIELKFHA